MLLLKMQNNGPLLLIVWDRCYTNFLVEGKKVCFFRILCTKYINKRSLEANKINSQSFSQEFCGATEARTHKKWKHGTKEEDEGKKTDAAINWNSVMSWNEFVISHFYSTITTNWIEVVNFDVYVFFNFENYLQKSEEKRKLLIFVRKWMGRSSLFFAP